MRLKLFLSTVLLLTLFVRSGSAAEKKKDKISIPLPPPMAAAASAPAGDAPWKLDLNLSLGLIGFGYFTKEGTNMLVPGLGPFFRLSHPLMAEKTTRHTDDGTELPKRVWVDLGLAIFANALPQTAKSSTLGYSFGFGPSVGFVDEMISVSTAVSWIFADNRADTYFVVLVTSSSVKF